MGVDLEQDLDLIDYFGVVAVWLIFFSIVFIISVTCILWCCVSDKDDSTVFAKWGLGPRGRDLQNRYSEPITTTSIVAGKGE
uniref:Movement protein n=1 Tax=Panagrellus redivivus TaxID=6233 RepID=A0A7E4V815_PANRE